MTHCMRLAAALMAVVACYVTAHTGTVQAPDFAFPATVSTQARQQLDNALQHRDDIAALRAFLDLTLADVAIDPGRVQQVMLLADTLDTRLDPTDAPAHAILNAIRARMLSDMYDADRHTYDARTLPLTPRDANPQLWSGEQFRDAIAQYTALSLTPADPLLQAPLSRYSELIQGDSLTWIYYPTLYDFAAQQALETSPTPDIYTRWLAHHPEAGAPRVNILLQQLEQANAARADTLVALYREYAPLTPYAADFLCSLPVEMQYAPLFADALERFPGYWQRARLQNIMAELCAPSLSVNLPQQCVPPGHEVQLQIDNSNVLDATLRILRLPDTGDLDSPHWTQPKGAPAPTLVDTIHLNVPDATLPFERKMTATYTFREPGRYIITSDIGEGEDEERTHAILYVTDIMLFSTEMRGSGAFWAVSGPDGAPQRGVTIHETGYRGTHTLGKTDQKGHLGLMSRSDPQYTVYGSLGRNITPPSYLYIPRPVERKRRRTVQMLTPLPLYHPGDTLQCLAILYDDLNGDARTLPDHTLTFVLRDANLQPVDTATATTDSFGRATARLAIPREGLTGTFAVTALDGSTPLGSCHVTVSDYKLATFEVLTKPAATDTLTPGDIHIPLQALAYNGTGIAGARVVLTLGNGPRWPGFHPGSTVYSAESLTDAAGRDTLTIPASAIAGAPYPQGIFTAQIAVTSPAGETRTADVRFSGTPAIFLTGNLKENLDVSAPVDIRISATAPDGSERHVPIEYALHRDSTLLRRAPLEGPVSFVGIPSGPLTVTFYAPGYPADSLQQRITIYRPDDTSTPAPDKTLWSPVDALAAHGGRARMLVAPAREMYALYTLSYNDSIATQQWMHLHPGINVIEVELPHNAPSASVSLAGIADYRSGSLTVAVTDSLRLLPPLTVTAERMRNRVVPGTEETLTLRITGTSQPAAVVADIYNGALRALTSHSLQLRMPTRYTSALSLRMPSGQYYDDYSRPAPFLRMPSLTLPELQTYGMPLYPSRRRMYNVLSRSMTADSNAVMEMSVEEESLNSAPCTLHSAPFAYREGETMLALWQPILTTEADGTLSLTYTLPPDNATWSVNLTAFTHAMQTGTLTADVVAARPVMVTPNLPRFLRYGDTAIIPATVFNNSDTLQHITVTTEAYNALTGSILQQTATNIDLPPGGQSTVSFAIEAPTAGSAIGYRVKAATDTYADGEQALLPLLDVIQPVVESTNFYLAPGQESATVQLPELPADAAVTLQYCANPVWNVVAALPGLLHGEPSTALEAARSIYAASTARMLLQRYPEIGRALDAWRESERSDSTLRSLLQRNTSLKMLMLAATPWVQAAEADTERMTRLALLFDEPLLEATLERDLTLLASLQAPDGGWRWTGSAYASPWITREVLTLLGRLNREHALPPMHDMAGRALAYADSLTAADHRRHPDATFFPYTRMRALWPEYKPTDAAQRAIDTTLAHLRNHWRTLPLADLPAAALLLGDPTLLRSLAEHAVTTTEQGMYWPRVSGITLAADALTAYAHLSPDAPAISALQQHLIMSKRGQDWGTAPATTAAIAAFLATAPGQLSEARPATFYADGTALHLTAADTFAGTYQHRLPTSTRTLTVERADTGTAYGSVVAQYRGFMADIAAASCPEVQITKQMYILAPDGTARHLPDSIPLGARVRVELTLTVNADLSYVAIDDRRPAAFEPVDQLPGYLYAEHLAFYRENRDAATRIYIDELPRGTYRLSYDMRANTAGRFTSGIATLQSMYAPELTAHSAGTRIAVGE